MKGVLHVTHSLSQAVCPVVLWSMTQNYWPQRLNELHFKELYSLPNCVNAIHPDQLLPKALLQSEGLVFNPASGSDGLTQGALFSRSQWYIGYIGI